MRALTRVAAVALALGCLAASPPLPLPHPNRPSGEAAPSVPLPPARPDMSSVPEASPPGAVTPPQLEPPAALSAEALNACTAALSAAGAAFEPAPAIAEGACVAGQPLRVTRITADVTMTPPGVMLCPVALALAQWVRDDLGPLAATEIRSPVRALQGGSGYECRNRNRAFTGRLSEHAFANAVDISGFVFANGATLAVSARPGDPTPESRFLDGARKAACARFTTVIGPGQPAHDDHFHFDLRQRRGGFRLCQ